MARELGDRRGFTLTELLVVIGIISLLAAIVIPSVARYLTRARMHAAEAQISEIEVALTAYAADFGTYPGDVFPTEDINNNGVLDTGEDVGVDVDRDGTVDYATVANNRIDRGDGVVNIDDLEWAFRTTAKNGPYMESIPLDPWDNKYVYYAPLRRPTYNSGDAADEGNLNFLWFDPSDDDTVADAGNGLPARTLCTEDRNKNGILDDGEDTGIADYDTIHGDVAGGFGGMRAGAGNGILDHGDDDNKSYDIETYLNTPNPYPPPVIYELGNADISPDGLSRNIGYYLYSVGRDGIDSTATGYEDISLNSILNDVATSDELTIDGGTFDEDINLNGFLDTGYEDTGIDGIPGTKDDGESDRSNGEATNPHANEEFGTRLGVLDTYHYNRHSDHLDVLDDEHPGFDIGGDDINSWNKESPWREHNSYDG